LLLHLHSKKQHSFQNDLLKKLSALDDDVATNDKIRWKRSTQAKQKSPSITYWNLHDENL